MEDAEQNNQRGVMQDAFAYCAALVRASDRDRFLASLFAPAELRPALHALYAFDIEVARVRELAHQPMPGEIRLQWWHEVVDGQRSAEAQANPVAAAFLVTIERHRLATAVAQALIEAHRFDLYDEPMARMADLEAYAAKTSSAPMAMAARILGAPAEAAAEGAGIALAIGHLMLSLPLHAARRQLYVPIELLEHFEVPVEDVFARRNSPGLTAALASLREQALRHLDAAHGHIMALPRAALPALLPVALLRPALTQLERSDPFAPRRLSPWRRQWLVWRAARNPARIAGQRN